MFIVMPLGHASFPGAKPGGIMQRQVPYAFEQDFLTEIMPLIEKIFNVSTDRTGITQTFIETPGGHSWPVWRLCLNELLPLLFK